MLKCLQHKHNACSTSFVFMLFFCVCVCVCENIKRFSIKHYNRCRNIVHKRGKFPLYVE